MIIIALIHLHIFVKFNVVNHRFKLSIVHNDNHDDIHIKAQLGFYF